MLFYIIYIYKYYLFELELLSLSASKKRHLLLVRDLRRCVSGSLPSHRASPSRKCSWSTWTLISNILMKTKEDLSFLSRTLTANWWAVSATEGFPGSSTGKESACNAGDLGSIPGLGRSPRGKGLPTPVFWPGEFHGLFSPWGCKELDTIVLS